MNLRLAVTVALAAATPVGAQEGLSGPKLTRIIGVVMDSVSGRPAEKVWVCVYSVTPAPNAGQPCVAVDSVGSYELGPVPLGTVAISLICTKLRDFRGRMVAVDTLQLPDSGELRKNWLVERTGCDTRPIRRISGVFRGHYTGGFEESQFVPCAKDAWFVPGDSLDAYRYDARHAWATIPRNLKVKWPNKVPHNDWGSAIVYLQWRGAIIGPGNYGHMGVAPFEIRVDSVLQIRAPRKNDCR